VSSSIAARNAAARVPVSYSPPTSMKRTRSGIHMYVRAAYSSRSPETDEHDGGFVASWPAFRSQYPPSTGQTGPSLWTHDQIGYPQQSASGLTGSFLLTYRHVNVGVLALESIADFRFWSPTSLIVSTIRFVISSYDVFYRTTPSVSSGSHPPRPNTLRNVVDNLWR